MKRFTKLEAVAFGSLLTAFFMLSYDMYHGASSAVLYLLVILFIGSSIAPEIEPEAFSSPSLFRLMVGLTGGIIAGAIMGGEALTVIMTTVIAVAISILSPVWYKVLELL